MCSNQLILHQAKLVTYQDGGDDEGAVGQGISDVHPFALRHFCDVKPSRRAPFPHLQKMKSVLLSVVVSGGLWPQQTPPPSPTGLPH